MTAAGASRASALVLLAALAVAAVVPLAFGDAPQDDAYISYVYARNFARGEGLVFNAGQPPVEGYTNFLWTLGIGLGLKAGLDPERVVPWVGLALTLLTVLATFRLGRRLGAPAPFAALGALLFATRPMLAVHAMGGLETPLFGLLVVLGLLPRLQAPPRGWGAEWASSGWLALAALTRPEGILFFGLLELFELGEGWRTRALGAALRRAAVRSVPFVLLVGAHLAWRRATYGDWVPNTFHAKVDPSLTTFADGLRYVGLGLAYFGPLFVLLPFFTGPPGRFRRGRVLGLVVGSVYALYVVYAGGDYIPSYRFLWPVIPLWSALLAASLSALCARLPRARPALLAVFLALLAGQTAAEYATGHRWEGMHERHRELVAAGRLLDRVLPPQAWIAVTNAGRLPYFADRRTIDMMGLSDAHIARVATMQDAPELAGHLKGDGGYVLDRQPDVICFLRLVVYDQPLARQKGWLRLARGLAFGVSERQIASDPRFLAEYRLYSLPLPGSEGGGGPRAWVNVFARRGVFGAQAPAGLIREPRAW